MTTSALESNHVATTKEAGRQPDRPQRVATPEASRPLTRRRRRWPVIIAAALVAGVPITQFAGKSPAGAFAPLESVRIGDIEISSSANGTVEAVRSVPLSLRAGGELTTLNAVVGQTVRTGDVLAIVDDAAARRDLDLRTSAVAEAEARMRGVENGTKGTPADRASSDAVVRQSEVQEDGSRAAAETADVIARESAELNRQLVEQAEEVAASDRLQVGVEELRLAEQSSKLEAAVANRNAAQAALTGSQERTKDAIRVRDAHRDELTALRQRIAELQAVRDDAKRAYDTAVANDERDRQAWQAALAATGLQVSFAWGKSTAVAKTETALVAAEKSVGSAEAATIPLQAILEKATETVSRQEAEQSASQGKFDSAVARLEGAQQGVDAAKRTREQAALTADRSGRAAEVARRNALVANRRDTQSVESARQTAAQAQAAAAAAKAAARAKEQPGRPADVAAAQAALRAATVSLEIAKDRLKEHRIVAPFDGTVTAVGAKVGEQVGNATSVVTLMSATELRIRVGFPEIDAAQIKTGNKATIGFDALRDTELTGRVEAVEPTATSVNGVSTYFARIVLDSVPETVRVGMSATVKVHTGTRRNVVVVPLAAVKQNDNGESFVHLVVDTNEPGSPVPGRTTAKTGENEESRVVKGRASDGKTYTRTVEVVPVTIGVNKDGSVEIVTGLSEGDVIEMPNEESK